jgi:hypothetical protein
MTLLRSRTIERSRRGSKDGPIRVERPHGVGDGPRLVPVAEEIALAVDTAAFDRAAKFTDLPAGPLPWDG